MTRLDVIGAAMEGGPALATVRGMKGVVFHMDYIARESLDNGRISREEYERIRGGLLAFVKAYTGKDTKGNGKREKDSVLDILCRLADRTPGMGRDAAEVQGDG